MKRTAQTGQTALVFRCYVGDMKETRKLSSSCRLYYGTLLAILSARICQGFRLDPEGLGHKK